MRGTSAFIVLACTLSVWLVPGRSHAAQPAGYDLTARATRDGEKVLVEFTLTLPVRNATAPDGQAVVRETRSARVLVHEGKRGSVVSGSVGGQPLPPGSAAGRKDVADVDDMESGFRLDVVSVKGADQVLVTASVVERGAAVWAQSKMIDVAPRPEKDRP